MTTPESLSHTLAAALSLSPSCGNQACVIGVFGLCFLYAAGESVISCVFIQVCFSLHMCVHESYIEVKQLQSRIHFLLGPPL